MVERSRGWRGAVLLAAGVTMAVLLASGSRTSAQGGPPAGPPPAPPTPRAEAPIDLTGYWVSIVNEDWRWRMVTPAKGDLTGLLQMNKAGQDLAKAWDPSTDGSCNAYGAAALMRMPTRLHITWETDTVLKIESDAGVQTRRLVFDRSQAAPPARTRQGRSVAEWEHTMRSSGLMGVFFFTSPEPLPPGGSLKVVTDNLRAGWLRKNGVPYSEQTVVTEYFDRFPAPDKTEWFVVTTLVNDPKDLLGPVMTSSHFRREADASKWNPQPCKGL